eukprot:16020-Heterococcus_DN1.PRE.1
MNHVSEIQQLMDKLNTTTPDLQEIDAELAKDAGFKLFLKASKASVLPKVKLPPGTEDKKQKELQAAMLVCELMWHSQSMEEKGKWYPESREKRTAKKQKLAKPANNDSTDTEDEPELDNNTAGGSSTQTNSSSSAAVAVLGAVAAAPAANTVGDSSGSGSGSGRNRAAAAAQPAAAASVMPVLAQPVPLGGALAPVLKGAAAAAAAAAAADVQVAAGNDAKQLWALPDQVNSGTLTTAHKRKLLLTISAMIQESV